MARANWRDGYAVCLPGLDEATQRIAPNDLVSLSIIAPPLLSDALIKRANAPGQLNLRPLAPAELPLLEDTQFSGGREIELFIGDSARPAHDTKSRDLPPPRPSCSAPRRSTLAPPKRASRRLPHTLQPAKRGRLCPLRPHLWLRKFYARRCRRAITVPRSTAIGDSVSKIAAHPDFRAELRREASRPCWRE